MGTKSIKYVVVVFLVFEKGTWDFLSLSCSISGDCNSVGTYNEVKINYMMCPLSSRFRQSSHHRSSPQTWVWNRAFILPLSTWGLMVFLCEDSCEIFIYYSFHFPPPVLKSYFSRTSFRWLLDSELIILLNFPLFKIYFSLFMFWKISPNFLPVILKSFCFSNHRFDF